MQEKFREIWILNCQIIYPGLPRLPREVREADVLLEVLDLAHPMIWERKRVVEEVLRELEVGEKPVVVALNKIDAVEDRFLINEAGARVEGSIPISAREQVGLDELLRRLDEELAGTRRCRRLLIPQSRPEAVALLHQKGKVVKTDYHSRNVYVEIEIEDRWLGNLREYLIEDG